nr:hypothetical protein [Salinibacter ruber]
MRADLQHHRVAIEEAEPLGVRPEVADPPRTRRRIQGLNRTLAPFLQQTLYFFGNGIFLIRQDPAPRYRVAEKEHANERRTGGLPQVFAALMIRVDVNTIRKPVGILVCLENVSDCRVGLNEGRCPQSQPNAEPYLKNCRTGEKPPNYVEPES